MKQTKPTKTSKELDEVFLNHYKANSQKLHQIAAHVYEFAEDDDDDTVNCVLRILEKYHSAKAEVYELLRTRK
jgi:hypothetical protein